MQHDHPLLVALMRSFYWEQLLDDSVVVNGNEIAPREGLYHSSTHLHNGTCANGFNELLRLTLLACISTHFLWHSMNIVIPNECEGSLVELNFEIPHIRSG